MSWQPPRRPDEARYTGTASQHNHPSALQTAIKETALDAAPGTPGLTAARLAAGECIRKNT